MAEQKPGAQKTQERGLQCRGLAVCPCRQRPRGPTVFHRPHAPHLAVHKCSRAHVELYPQLLGYKGALIISPVIEVAHLGYNVPGPTAGKKWSSHLLIHPLPSCSRVDLFIKSSCGPSSVPGIVLSLSHVIIRMILGSPPPAPALCLLPIRPVSGRGIFSLSKHYLTYCRGFLGNQPGRGRLSMSQLGLCTSSHPLEQVF